MLFLETSEEKKRIGYESLLSQYENFLVIVTRFRSKNSSPILMWFYRETLLIAYNLKCAVGMKKYIFDMKV